jgi:putative FmdB family regulatory protein
MPTYEYACTDCEHQFEQFQPITAAPLRECPKCRRRTLRRLIGTGGGVLFRGSGFYQTDYRSESYKKAAEAESKAASGGSKDSASKPADAKPAEAGKPKPQTQAEDRPPRRKRSS